MSEKISDTDSEAQEITAAVEKVLDEKNATIGMSAEDKNAIATQIYTTWRNSSLRGLNQQAFMQVEAASSALIAGIVAKLP